MKTKDKPEKWTEVEEKKNMITGQNDDNGEEVEFRDREWLHPQGCCGARGTKVCCLITGGIGALFLLLGLIVLVAGPGLLLGVVLKKIPLAPGSETLQSWLTPPVTPHLTGYGFHLTNPEEVSNGGKPILKEIGPFVYKAITVKDSVDEDTKEENLKFNDDGETLTYRARKYYYLDKEQSVGDPATTFMTVPNVPFLTGLHKIRKESPTVKGIGEILIRDTGLGTPFINVSFDGLLWGYNDELPCSGLDWPAECGAPAGSVDIFSMDDDDTDYGDSEPEYVEYEYEEEEWKRKKRSAIRAMRYKRDTEEGENMKTIHHGLGETPKAEYVDCKCEWGLFRDRNMTLRKPVTLHHGVADITKKGLVTEFDNSKTMNWWIPGSKCDELGGSDASTLPPSWKSTDAMDMFISLMCRRINLEYEMETEHAGITTLRYIPPPNAMGSHTDEDPERRNEDNACYCYAEKGFACLKSGVLNMAPCKVKDDLKVGAPIALSYPHFYQAHPSFLEAVEGLEPNKEKHQFYVDLEPTLGFPLAIRPRFQLNAILRRDPDIEVARNFPEELVLPFLWAQDGFSEPSEEMANKVRFGVFVPNKLPIYGGVVFLVLGLILLGSSLGWVYWAKKNGLNISQLR